MKTPKVLWLAAVMMVAGCGEAELVTHETALHSDFRPVPEQFQITQALGSSGRAVLFLNFEGQTIRYGGSSSKQNTSWIVPQGYVAPIPAFRADHYGASRAQAIATVVEYVKRDFANYDVTVTTQRPTQGDYTMVMVGGTPSLIGESSGVAGIAPLDLGNPNRNDVVFVFSDTLDDLRELATCVTHEAGHSFGLEHVTPQDAIMYPVLQKGNLRFAHAQVYGRNYFQNQPQILFKLFGAPSSTSPAPAPQPAPAPAPADDDAVFVSQEIPAELAPGEEFLARVTFKNTGDTTWSGGSGYALMADASTWGGDTLVLPFQVSPGSSRTISFYARAPQTPGTYAFQWYLTRDGQRFGTASTRVNITVRSTQNRIPQGQLEYADGDWGYGWAWDPDAGSASVWVDIYVGGQYAGSITADRTRNDLASRGVVGTAHGFAFQMPALGSGTHKVQAFAVDDQGEYAYRLGGEFFVAQ